MPGGASRKSFASGRSAPASAGCAAGHEKPGRPAGSTPVSAPVEKVVEGIPFPAAAAILKAAAQHRIAAGRQTDQQVHALAAPAQGQSVSAGRESGKEGLRCLPAPAGAARQRPEEYPVLRTGVLPDHTDAAAGVSRPQAQGSVTLLPAFQADPADGQQAFVWVYCSSLALTRYVPPLT